jgi:hypothetical protein
VISCMGVISSVPRSTMEATLAARAMLLSLAPWSRCQEQSSKVIRKKRVVDLVGTVAQKCGKRSGWARAYRAAVAVPEASGISCASARAFLGRWLRTTMAPTTTKSTTPIQLPPK